MKRRPLPWGLAEERLRLLNRQAFLAPRVKLLRSLGREPIELSQELAKIKQRLAGIGATQTSDRQRQNPTSESPSGFCVGGHSPS